MTEKTPVQEAIEHAKNLISMRENGFTLLDCDLHTIALYDALRTLQSGKGEISDGYHTFNELYEHRHILFLFVLKASGDNAWRSKLHSDGTMFDGWFIAGLNTDLGQATYHMPERMWELLRDIQELDRAPEWDGHTSNDVLVRIREAALTTPPEPVNSDKVDVEKVLSDFYRVADLGKITVGEDTVLRRFTRHLATLGLLRGGDGKQIAD